MFEMTTEEGILTLTINEVGTLTLAILLLILGSLIKKKFTFLQTYFIPAPVIGGFVFAILHTFLRGFNILQFNMDTLFQDPFMIFFYVTIGISATFGLLKKGGKQLFMYFISTAFIIVTLALMSVGLASLFSIEPLLGLISGPPSLAGGHGSVASYAPSIEDLGYENIMVVGMAVATAGLIGGSALGGPVSKRLIKKYNLKNNTIEENDDLANERPKQKNINTKETNANTILVYIAVITVCMTIGGFITDLLVNNISGFVLPSFAIPLILALFIRNMNDKVNLIHIDLNLNDKFSDIALGIFLSMALMTLPLWELVDLAIPILGIFIVEVFIVVLFVYFIVFRLLGSNYDAAVMCGGLIGHGLGATPNAIANMDAIAEKHGRSKIAFIIVPAVGGFMQDWILIPITITAINLLS